MSDDARCDVCGHMAEEHGQFKGGCAGVRADRMAICGCAEFCHSERPNQVRVEPGQPGPNPDPFGIPAVSAPLCPPGTALMISMVLGEDGTKKIQAASITGLGPAPSESVYERARKALKRIAEDDVGKQNLEDEIAADFESVSIAIDAGEKAEQRAEEINNDLNRARWCLGRPSEGDGCGECQNCLRARAETAERERDEAREAKRIAEANELTALHDLDEARAKITRLEAQGMKIAEMADAETKQLRARVAELEERDRRLFPIQRSGRTYKGPPWPNRIPWPIAEKAYSVYVTLFGSDQTLERLSQRGGFSPEEMDEFYPSWRDDSEAIRLAQFEIDKLKARVAECEALLKRCDPKTMEPPGVKPLPSVGVSGDRCEPGNECGRCGCPNCQA